MFEGIFLELWKLQIDSILKKLDTLPTNIASSSMIGDIPLSLTKKMIKLKVINAKKNKILLTQKEPKFEENPWSLQNTYVHEKKETMQKIYKHHHNYKINAKKITIGYHII